MAMGSGARKRQTFAKLSRERAVQERRELKRQKKLERKLAAAEGNTPEAENPQIPEADEAQPE
jgi:hypothetical protein